MSACQAAANSDYTACVPFCDKKGIAGMQGAGQGSLSMAGTDATNWHRLGAYTELCRAPPTVQLTPANGGVAHTGPLHSLTLEGSHLLWAGKFMVCDCQGLPELQVGLPGDKRDTKDHENVAVDDTLR